MSKSRKVLVDGRVFSSDAHDRGMGKYLRHLLTLLKQDGNDVTLLLFRNTYVDDDDPCLSKASVRFANYDPEAIWTEPGRREEECHAFSHYLSALIQRGSFDIYIDATPFLGPCRLDIVNCAVVTVCYDFIPLRYPEEYFRHPAARDYYADGLTRVAKADSVICISETVADEVRRYLAVPPKSVFVICPSVDPEYYQNRVADGSPEGRYLSAMLGSHRSKNPTLSLRIYEQILSRGLIQVRVNSPKEDQFDTLMGFGIPKGMEFTHSLSDEEKRSLQAGSTVLAHLSIEEGFGIPLLEGLFLGKKIIALDMPMNREILSKAGAPHDGAVLLLSKDAEEIDLDQFARFLGETASPGFYEGIRTYYLGHWRRGVEIVDAALDEAALRSAEWLNEVEFNIVSSVPGTNCGVADYSAAYTRSSSGNVIFFFSEGDEKSIRSLPTVRLVSCKDYAIGTSARPAVPTLFNFAFSDALFPGIELMRRHARPIDRLLVHERHYLPGLLHFLLRDNLMEDFLLERAGAQEPAASIDALATAKAPQFNLRPAARGRLELLAEWFSRLPLTPISHLSPAVLEKMREFNRATPSSLNDMEDIEDQLEFVPLGIDPRRHPAIARAGATRRRRYGVQPDDLLVGHFGLVVPGNKYLAEVARGVASAALRLRSEGRTFRRIFFSLVGRIIDVDLYDYITQTFADAGLAVRLLEANPVLEAAFDAEIAACDVIVCLRNQQRGQLSHVFVRALSLGRPVIVNRDSGYSYDPATTISDEDIEGEISRRLLSLVEGNDLVTMRRRAHAHYEDVHRGDQSLQAILKGEYS